MAVVESQIHFLELPELVTRRILSHMTFVDLCLLRLTCKTLQEWSNGFLPPLTRLKFEIVQGSSTNTFEASLSLFQNLELNIEELHIKNDSAEVYEEPLLQEFVELYGHGIRKLCLQTYVLDSVLQFNFLQNLPNLQEFEIETINGTGHQIGYTKSRRPFQVLQLPGFFEHLKVLKFGTIKLDTIMDTDFWYAMITSARRLNHLRYPRIECQRHCPGVNHPRKFECFKELILNQRTSFRAEEEQWLQTIDFVNLDVEEDIEYELSDFFFFVDEIKAKNINLMNVHANYFGLISDAMRARELRTFNCVSSILEYQPHLYRLPFKNLEKITIRDMDQVIWKTPVHKLEKLKSVELYFDRVAVLNKFQDPDEDNISLQNFLFQVDGRNGGLEELKISFDLETIYFDMPSHLLNGRKIANLECLRKLTLIGWNPVNKVFVRLWKGLPLLEELWIETCPSLGNVGFIGENLAAPAFLNLKKLVKLTLGLDEMKKLTDTCFKEVFRHVGLREFTLLSTSPHENLTKTGISWLLQGKFTTTIERFPFTSWSSSHISKEEMMDLKSQFKSLLS